MITKDNRTVLELAEESNTEGMIEVLREERREYVEKETKLREDNKKQVQDKPENKVQLDKSVEVDLEDDTNVVEVRICADFDVVNIFFQKSDEVVEDMECDQEAVDKVEDKSSASEPEEVKEDAPKSAASEEINSNKEDLGTPPVVTPGSPECNKENVNSDETVSSEDNNRDVPANKPKDAPKPKSPFTAVNPKQKESKTKPLTPGSRGAMLLSLSRRVGHDLGPQEVSAPVPRVPPSVTIQNVSVTVSPLRPWVKYAPSPSHASPSAGILKRSADDLDSSTEVRSENISRLFL